MARRSNDPATLSQIERRYFVNATLSSGDSLRYGDWHDTESAAQSCVECWGRGEIRSHGLHAPICKRCDVCRGSGRVRAVALTVIESATGGDYSGTLVEISNARTLKEEFPWLIEIYGGHGTRGLAYLGARENQNPALIEAIDSLTQYPVYSDDDHSQLEWEMAAQAWEDDGREDFRRALTKHFDALYGPDAHDLSEIADERIDQLWRDCAERLMGGEEYLNESGGSIYFPIDNVIKKLRASYLGLDCPSYDGTRPSINAQLTNIASDGTIGDEDPTGADDEVIE